MLKFALIKNYFKKREGLYLQTLDVYKKLFKRFDTNQICLSLNGGKDSTVIFFLTLFFRDLL